jgi:DNA-binding LytR/AlgR family response regulator
MKKINILIAEDEQPQRLALQQLIFELTPDANIVACCEDGLLALEAIQQHQIDIAFLDIRMPGVSGLEVARAAPTSTHIVFTTAYDEYAVNAFEAGAVDYLLKPIKRERLLQAIQRSRLRLQLHAPSTNNMHALIDKLQQQLQNTNRNALKWISASVGDTIKMFAIEDVQFFQAQEKYVRVVTDTDEAIIRTPLKELMAGLDPEIFWQVHRSLLVRANAIQRVKRDDLGKFHLHLKGSTEILPVSGAFQHRFKAM